MFARNCDYYFFELPLIFSIFISFSLLQLINKGKGEALRIRAILRSLVPTEDLVGIISIPLKMPITNKGSQDVQSDNTQHVTSPPHLRSRHILFICLLQQDFLHMRKYNGYETLHI